MQQFVSSAQFNHLHHHSMILLVRIFPEIAIKSRPVRKRLVQRLCSNIGLACHPLDKTIKIKSLWDKIKVSSESTDPKVQQLVIRKLQQIPGIQDFSIVEDFDFLNSDDLFTKTLLHYQDQLTDRSFAVRVKRVGIHPFTSLDLEREIGRRLLETCSNSSVNLTKPDVTVKIEIKDDQFYLYHHYYPGLNGYPIGAQEKVLSLISGGFDSSVSSFLMMQKGCKVDFLFFNLGGYAHELGVKEVSKYLSSNYSDGYGSSFISVNFEPIIAELMESIDPKYRGLILKRCMLKIAEQLCQVNDYKAIITGESLGQVSSQTLINL
ncbi:MAG: tRNA 4-thiouridine(8) synthase ThiI, partial [Calditrichaeota bacterium]|nr:tRNA 4-thiouridine(8) synthase ThiI [Calditrichota bacterium]